MRTAFLLVLVGGLTAAAGPAPKADAPKPRDEALRQELLRRMRADQEARKALAVLLSGPKVPDAKALLEKDPAAVWRVRDVDRDNAERMKEILTRHGWPGKTLVGTDGAHAAWLLAHHADHDRPFQRRCLALLKEAVKKGEATGQQLAYLTDRLCVAEKRPQVYGTQMLVVGGKVQAAPHRRRGERGPATQGGRAATAGGVPPEHRGDLAGTAEGRAVRARSEPCQPTRSPTSLWPACTRPAGPWARRGSAAPGW